MDKPIDHYWNLKLESLKENLVKNKFDVFIAQNAKDAKMIALNDIIPDLGIKSVSWGGSVSFVSTGLFHELSKKTDIDVLNTFNKDLSKEEMMDLRRQSLLVDLFITGTNAVTEAGHLVNLDMVGNRVAAIMWGPKNVLLIIGRNKICSDLVEAMLRIKNYAAPVILSGWIKKRPVIKQGSAVIAAVLTGFAIIGLLPKKVLKKTGLRSFS